jgi:hypothetical protein
MWSRCSGGTKTGPYCVHGVSAWGAPKNRACLGFMVEFALGTKKIRPRMDDGVVGEGGKILRYNGPWSVWRAGV